MLRLGEGVQTIEGVTVFPDHADESLYWYLPAPVSLARRQDGRAQFTFIKYRPAAVEGGAKGGGFLMFTSALLLDKETEAKIRSKLHAKDGPPRLTAVQFDEGTVQCVALNLQGGGGTSAAAAPEGSFNAVETILGAQKPSLIGDNNAVFSLSLSQEGATILEQALEQGTTPIGVIYDLKFTGLRPALDVKITADLERCYQQFSASLTASVYFLQVGIDAGFEKLVQDGAIKIEVTNFSTDADKADKEKWALDFFKEKLLAEWFTPTLTPGTLAGAQPAPGKTTPPPGVPSPPAPPPPPGAAPQTPGPPSPPAGQRSPALAPPPPPPPAGQPSPALAPPPPPPPAGQPSPALAPPPPPPLPPAGQPRAPSPPAAPAPPVPAAPAAPAPAVPAGQKAPAPTGQQQKGGGDSGSVAISFKLKAIVQEERKTLTFEYHSSEAAQRQYAPQGLLGLLAADLRREDYFVEVDLDAPFFQIIEIDAEVPVDMAKIGLQSVTVALDYGPEGTPEHKHTDLVFDRAHTDPQHWKVFVDQALDLGYRYRAEFNFDAQSGWQGEQLTYLLESDWTEDRTLSLNPFKLLGFLEVDVFPHRIDAGIVSWTDVILAHGGNDGWTTEKTLTVLPGSLPQVWRVRTNSPDERRYSYRFIHHLKDGTTRETAPKFTTATSVLVDDPFMSSIEPYFVWQFPPEQFTMVIVDVQYDDDDNGYHRKERLELGNGAIKPASLRIATIDPKLVKYRYQVTLIGPNGEIVRGPSLDSESSIVGVTATGGQ